MMKRKSTKINDDFMNIEISFSNTAKALIQDMLTQNEQERITASEIMVKYKDWFEQNIQQLK